MIEGVSEQAGRAAQCPTGTEARLEADLRMKNASGIVMSERIAPPRNAEWMPSAVAAMTLAPSSIRGVDVVVITGTPGERPDADSPGVPV